MTNTILRKTFCAFLLATGASGVASAQPPIRPTAVPPGVTGTDPNTIPQPIRAKQIIGTKISLQNNTAAGTVDDIVLSDAGEVEYLIVVRDDGKLVSVPWSATTFNFQQKTAVVNISPEQYNVIPTFTVTTYPQFFTPTYRMEIYKSYGLTPGQFRRMERRLDRP